MTFWVLMLTNRIKRFKTILSFQERQSLLRPGGALMDRKRASYVRIRWAKL